MSRLFKCFRGQKKNNHSAQIVGQPLDPIVEEPMSLGCPNQPPFQEETSSASKERKKRIKEERAKSKK